MAKNMATALSGNTNAESAKKRMFQLTLNCEISNDKNYCEGILMNNYVNIKKYLTSLKFNYLISCIEKNEKNYSHIHIFVQFNTPHKLSIKKCNGAHIEYCKGSVNDNIKYIKKDGNILDEIGTPKLIIGSARIKDIIKNNDRKELLKLDYKYINCINSIKGPDWYQPLLNGNKHIYFFDKDSFKAWFAPSFNKNYTFVNLDDKNKFHNISSNIVMYYNQNVFRLLNYYNVKIQNFHVNDIKNIILLYSNISDYRHFINKHNEFLLNHCPCTIHKKSEFDNDETNNYNIKKINDEETNEETDKKGPVDELSS